MTTNCSAPWAAPLQTNNFNDLLPPLASSLNCAFLTLTHRCKASHFVLNSPTIALYRRPFQSPQSRIKPIKSFWDFSRKDGVRRAARGEWEKTVNRGENWCCRAVDRLQGRLSKTDNHLCSEPRAMLRTVMLLPPCFIQTLLGGTLEEEEVFPRRDPTPTKFRPSHRNCA